jgi:1-acyl-sn-glycerol-3-phosphate acyltransferase
VIGTRLQYARRVPGRPRVQILWWDISQWLSQQALRIFYRFRVDGRERVPRTGPVLFVSNHQSHFDPIINGAQVADRQFTAIAKEGLFSFKPFAWLIRSYGALSVAGDAGDSAAIKVALAELEAGRCILIYPEGTRSGDGRLTEFQKGVLLLQRRAKVDVLPLALEGATDVWPRGTKRPKLRGRIAARVGTPIPAAEFAALAPDAALERLESEIDRLRLELRAEMRAATGGRWPLAGPADAPRTPRVLEAPRARGRKGEVAVQVSASAPDEVPLRGSVGQDAP